MRYLLIFFVAIGLSKDRYLLNTLEKNREKVSRKKREQKRETKELERQKDFEEKSKKLDQILLNK